MSDNDEMITEFWTTDNFTNIIFTDVEMKDLMDSASHNLQQGFGFWKRKLRSPKTRAEILNAVPEQREEWVEPLSE